MAGLHLTVKWRVGVSPISRIMAALAAFVLFVGTAGVVLAACGAVLPSLAAAIGCIAAACAVAVGGAIAGRGRAERLFYLIAAGAIAVVCLVLAGSFAGGAAHLANGLIMRIGERTQEYALPFVAGGEADLVFFCAAAGAALGLAYGLMAQHGGVLPAVVIGLAALAGVIAGWLPVGWWAPVLALGVFLLVAGRAALASDAPARTSLAWAFAGVLAVCAVAACATALVFRSETADTEAAQAAVADVLWKTRYGDASFAMPEGDLRDVGDLQASDQPAITVSVDQPTFEYLRGFVGERYAENRWQPLEGEAVMAARDDLYWLDRDGFAAASQLSQTADLIGYEKGNPAALSLQLENVRGPYAYLPYGYADGASAHLTTDMAQTRCDGGDAQQTAFGAGLTRQAYLLQDALDAAQARASMVEVASPAKDAAAEATATAETSAGKDAEHAIDLRTYLDDEAAYRAFAEDSYLEVPDDVRAVFERLYGPPVKLTAEQAKIQVQYRLDDTVAYADGSEDDAKADGAKADGASDREAAVEAADEDAADDFVARFLTQTRAGYSVHYATAATLLMRYYGVPARYVEGYVLNTAQLDAQAAAEAAANGAAADVDAGAGAGAPAAADASSAAPFAGAYTLTERQAHAWVEYYLDGVGWVPFDVTPGWRAAGYYETTPNTELIEESQNWSVGQAARDAVWTPPEQEQQSEEEQTPPSPIFAELDFLIVEWPWALLGFLLTLVIALIVRDVLLHARLRRFREQASDGTLPPRDAVGALFSYAVLLVRDCGGVHLENAPYAAQDAAVSAAGLCASGVFASAAEANDRALFANADPTDADMQAVAACVDELQHGLRSKQPLATRFWQRHVRCLW